MESISEAEASLQRSVQRDSETKRELVLKVLKDMRDNPDRGSNSAGQACEICPPLIRPEFIDFLIKELEIYCEHEDSAIPIAEYIVQEIKNNTRSKAADSIRGSLESSFWDYTSPIVKPTRYSNALAKFAAMVNTNRPWDHKPIIKVKFKDQGVERPNRFDGSGAIYKTFYTKYKDYDYFYDVWSNIHYGYVGMSLGFSEFELTAGSNIQQLGHDLRNLELNSGDTGADKATILIGIDLYNKFGKYGDGLTAQDVLDALDSNVHLQTNLDQESKQTHWCWHSKNQNPKKKK